MFFIINTGIISDPLSKQRKTLHTNSETPAIPKKMHPQEVELATENLKSLLKKEIIFWCQLYIYIYYIFIFLFFYQQYMWYFIKCCYGYGPWQHHEKVQLK